MKIQQNQKKSVKITCFLIRRVFSDRGREGLFLRAFEKRNIR
jgi:hypothetical protein